MKVVENESWLTIEACRGSVEAFEVLVTYYEPRIRRMLYGLTHDVQLTQDLCQETFLAAYKALPRMDGNTLQFAPWLYRIALNQVRSEWRRHKHVTLIPFLSSGSEDDPYEEQCENYLFSEDPFEERIVELDLVRRTLAQMPHASALCLLLDAEGFSYSEIAEIVQDSLAAVRSRLSRARQTFRRIYAGLDRGGR